jgi:hypothetical protein
MDDNYKILRLNGHSDNFIERLKTWDKFIDDYDKQHPELKIKEEFKMKYSPLGIVFNDNLPETIKKELNQKVDSIFQ